MNSYVENLSPKEWEEFCEIMLRYHFTQKNFWVVPDEDQGDLGLEFFTANGILFQCYYPDSNTDLKTYKGKIQKKIREDLKKLKKNEKDISILLDGITINQWVLLIPELSSKELIKYCHKKKKEVIEENLSFIDASAFRVKIETAKSFPDGQLFAQNISSKAIDIPLIEVTAQDKQVWHQGNSEFSSNIVRKSNALMGTKAETFQNTVVTKYIQIEKFLDQLREEHPDLHDLIEDSARARLENMQEESLFEDELDKGFVQQVVKSNEVAFTKHSKFMSDKNMQSLSFGYLSKWLAECYMDFDSE